MAQRRVSRHKRFDTENYPNRFHFYVTMGSNDLARLAVLGSATYPTASSVPSVLDFNTTAFIRNSFSGGTYFMEQAILRFDTSSIPEEATIIGTEITGGIDSSNTFDDDNMVIRSYWVEIAPWRDVDQQWRLPNTPDDDTMAMPVGLWNALSVFFLTMYDPEENINRSGWSGIRLVIEDQFKEKIPTGQNQLYLALSVSSIKLHVVYEMPLTGGEAAFISRAEDSGIITPVTTRPSETTQVGPIPVFGEL